MGLHTYLGTSENILDEQSSYVHVFNIMSHVLSKVRLNVILNFGTTFKNDLKSSLNDLVRHIVKRIVENNVHIVVLTDENLNKNKAVFLCL